MSLGEKGGLNRLMANITDRIEKEIIPIRNKMVKEEPNDDQAAAILLVFEAILKSIKTFNREMEKAA